jgi:hypothetical protein
VLGLARLDPPFGRVQKPYRLRTAARPAGPVAIDAADGRDRRLVDEWLTFEQLDIGARFIVYSIVNTNRDGSFPPLRQATSIFKPLNMSNSRVIASSITDPNILL